MQKIILTTFLVTTSIVLSSCSNGDDVNSIQVSHTITAYIGINSDYSSLKTAIDSTNLINALSVLPKQNFFVTNTTFSYI